MKSVTTGSPRLANTTAVPERFPTVRLARTPSRSTSPAKASPCQSQLAPGRIDTRKRTITATDFYSNMSDPKSNSPQRDTVVDRSGWSGTRSGAGQSRRWVRHFSGVFGEPR